MHDPWTDRLSDYIDGGLDADEARRLENHLAACDDCTATLADLEAVVARARALHDREPVRDLWAGIAAGIAADVRPQGGETAGPGAAAPASAGDVIVFDAGRRRAARSFSFTIPQLAAAAMLLMTVSAGAVWFTLRSDGTAGSGAVAMQGTIFQSAAPEPAAVRLVDARPADDAEYESLAALLEEARETLDPATVDVLERSLESIQDAIAAAHAALAADPGNPRLQRQLDSTLQRRQELAARVNRVQRGGA